MKKVIVLTKFIPAPAFSGGAIRSRAWIRFLSKYYDIIVIGYWDKKFGSTRVGELKDYAKEVFGFDFVRTKTSLFHKAATIWTSYNKDVILVSNRGEDSLERI